MTKNSYDFFSAYLQALSFFSLWCQSVGNPNWSKQQQHDDFLLLSHMN